MAKVIVGMTVSLDGFVNDRNGSVARLYPDLAGLRKTEVLQEAIANTAAVVVPEAAVVAKYVAAVSNILERVLRKHGKKVIEKEYQQERLANVVMDLYACLAVLSRATAALEKRGREKTQEELRLARAFVQSAKYRIVGQLKEMDRNVEASGNSRDALQTGISESAYSRLGYAFHYWE